MAKQNEKTAHAALVGGGQTALHEHPMADHWHTASGDGGQLEWENVWADAVHEHTGSGEGGQLDHGAALTGLSDDDHPQYLKEEASGGVASEVPDHTHQNTANCGQLDHGTALTGLGDNDHPQYRLASDDHTHQSAGIQGGKLDHGLALNGLGDNDHPQYVLASGYPPKLNACAAPDGAVDFNKQQATSLVIENRTSDPSSPATGQIWLRTDLL